MYFWFPALISAAVHNVIRIFTTGVSRRKLRNETPSNSWENLTKWSGFTGCKIADFRYISPFNYGFSMLFGSSPTQETFPLARYFQRKIFRRLKPIIRKNNPMPSEKVFHVSGVFRRLVGQHSNSSVLTPIMAYYKHGLTLSILEGSLSVIRRSFTSDNNYSQCCIYPAYISINIKTPFITNDHQIICA